MKAVTHSWWIGAIISTVLTFAFLGTDSSPNVGMLLFMGIVNGVFWGWLIGLLIDKIGRSFKNENLTPDTIGEHATQKVNSDASYERGNQTSINAGYALELSRIITENKALKKQPKPREILRTDGYYVASKSYAGDTRFFLLFFTSKGFVALGEPEEFDNSDYSKEEYRQVIAEGETLTEIEVSPYLTEYTNYGENILMKFYDPTEYSNIDPIEKVPYDDPVVYNKWSGRIIPNGLLLDLEVSRFSNALKDYERKHLIRDLKFDFIPIGMN
ncbi:hypothetical protein [Marivirga sp.]|uniref:hypothetical protein n=1 Tax=Marivirga sp. TaxID=2018662 RepID=UPI0025FFF5A7|nr:hypothetical protein [Marivirga sp.]